MDLVLWIDIFEVSMSIANLRNELKCVLKATLEIKFSGVAFFVQIKKSLVARTSDNDKAYILVNL